MTKPIKKYTAVWIVLGVVIVVVIVIAFLIWRLGVVHSPNGVSSVPSPEASAVSTPTRTAVPANAVVVDEGAQNVAANVAVPQSQVTLARSAGMQYRSFDIAISGNAYSPSTVVVNQGDVVNLTLTAMDANYGFTQPDYGYDVAIPLGKTQRIQFQATMPGQFTFYCSSCGGPSKGPVGYLIVK